MLTHYMAAGAFGRLMASWRGFRLEARLLLQQIAIMQLYRCSLQHDLFVRCCTTVLERFHMNCNVCFRTQQESCMAVC